MRLVLVALLAVIFSAPAAAQPAPPGPGVPPPTLPGRACTTPAGVCWMHPSAAPGTPCQCFASAGWVAGVVREWVWDAPPSR